MALQPSLAERLGSADPATWPLAAHDWRVAPTGLAFLNVPEAPAGKRGFVRAVGEQLQFADGSTARFWGTNVTAYALFNTPKDAVKQQARRLSELGFNLVRLHHHDSPWVNPNVFGDTKKMTDTQRLQPEQLDKLDWWVKCLKEEGIYIWLDLHVQRAFKAGDGITGFDEMRKGKDVADLKGYNYVNPDVLQTMKRFNEAYVKHVNPYTSLAAKDEPAIASMLITNENDLTHHFGNALLPDKQVPMHNRWYTAQADAFAARHGLPKDKVWRSWVPGPSKLLLNDLEQRFNADMLAHLRGLGVKVPLATTNAWGYGPLFSLPALTVGDVVDAHAYGGVDQLKNNPLMAPNLTHWLATAQVAGKPMTVTEWNAEPFPTPDRHALPLFVAGVASLQGWDALMQYAYTQESVTGPGSPSNWHAHNDPSLLATLPAAALMYRQGHAREAITTYVFDPGADALFGQNISASNSVALRTAAEKGKLLIAMPATKELPWLPKSTLPVGAKIMRDPAASQLDANAQEATSDTGELSHNWAKGTYTINTPRTQAAMGWLGGQTLPLKDIELTTTTRSATLAVQSLDGQPITQSKDLMISLGTRSVPQAGNRVPFNVEPFEGVLKVNARKGLKLFKRNAQQQLEGVPTSYKDGAYTIKLDSSLRTNWLFLRHAE
ncbi:MAG: glycosyl hydrolase family 5 [Comamonadaceae bacterium]|nr:glycosyl hydrolase family 5 [Comamonadaceae bacterium]